MAKAKSDSKVKEKNTLKRTRKSSTKKKVSTSETKKRNYLHCAEDEDIRRRCDRFSRKVESSMHYKSDLFGNSLSFDWIDIIEEACPFIDNVIRVPKLTLIQETSVVKIEKAKKTNVDSVKDLSKHTNFISKLNKKTGDVEPEKILEVRNEETFNIYENRFLYTLLDTLNRFLIQKEDQLNNFEINDKKVLEYEGSSITDNQKISIQLRVSANELPKDNEDESLKKEIEDAKTRVKRIREYLSSWNRSEMIKALNKAHISLVRPPIKKTNIIFHNPNFKVAVKLWDFLQSYGYTCKDTNKNVLDTDGDDNLRGFLDHSFLIDYFVLDSVSSHKKDQRDKMSKYAIYVITHEIYKTVELLLNSGIKITDDELITMVSKVIKDEKNNRLVGAEDVKKKFKNEMDEYLERMQDNL